MELKKNKTIFDFDLWESRVKDLHREYVSNDPFPHMVFENFLNSSELAKGINDFPEVHSDDWTHYVHANEKKYGQSRRSAIGPQMGAIIDELNSDRFVRFLENLTGYKGLFADSSMEGGGLAQAGRGGFLNIHKDFTVHPHHREWRRRVNLLVYLNEDWKDEYGGHLELWDKDVKKCVKRVLPLFNRAVIFSTDTESYHGFPDPIQCPEERSRRSINLYYFGVQDKPAVHGTDYRPRPDDSLGKRIMIRLDKFVLFCYDQVKRRLKLDDKFASRMLGRVDKFLKSFSEKKD